MAERPGRGAKRPASEAVIAAAKRPFVPPQRARAPAPAAKERFGASARPPAKAALPLQKTPPASPRAAAKAPAKPRSPSPPPRGKTPPPSPRAARPPLPGFGAMQRSPWPSAAKAAASPKRAGGPPSPAPKPKPKAPEPKVVATRTVEEQRPERLDRMLDSLFRAETVYGPPREHVEVRTEDGARRSARLHDRAEGGTTMGEYWPGGALTPKSRNALGQAGGAGTFQMAVSPRAHRGTKEHQLKRGNQRMYKWLDTTILNQDANMWTFPTSFFKQASHKVGILRMQAACEPELRYEVSETTRAMVRDTLLFSDYRKAKTVTTADVQKMLKINGITIWMPPLKSDDD